MRNGTYLRSGSKNYKNKTSTITIILIFSGSYPEIWPFFQSYVYGTKKDTGHIYKMHTSQIIGSYETSSNFLQLILPKLNNIIPTLCYVFPLPIAANNSEQISLGSCYINHLSDVNHISTG